MPLADRIAAPSQAKSRFETWLGGLAPRHSEQIIDWGRDDRISINAIRNAIRDDDPDDDFVGYRVGKETLGAWRRTL